MSHQDRALEEMHEVFVDVPRNEPSSPSNGQKKPQVSPRSDDYLHITVSDPRKEQESIGSLIPRRKTHYSYLVTTRMNLTDYGGHGSESKVRRRFSDFKTLSDRLFQLYPGSFILKCAKQLEETMQEQKSEEQRMVALEKYLRNLASHPVIGKSEKLIDFLRLKENEEFLETKKLTELEQLLMNLTEEAESLTKYLQAIGEKMGVKLSESETEEAILKSQRIGAADMSNAATAADESREGKIKKLEDAIRDSENANISASEVHEQIKKIDRSELERFDKEA